MKVMNAWNKCKSQLPKIFLWDGCMFWPTLYITARVLYWYEPWHGVPIEKFDRIMGNATQMDMLVSARTGQAMLLLVLQNLLYRLHTAGIQLRYLFVYGGDLFPCLLQFVHGAPPFLIYFITEYFLV